MKNARTAPTLLDVALRAGVSTATVSRCLNLPGRVAEETRKKVGKAVLELGYSPNFGARIMAAKRTNIIGAIIPTMENAIFARGLQAFQDELGTHGFTLLVASSSYRADREEEQIRSLVARGAEGLLLIGHARDAAIYGFLRAQNVPVVVTWALAVGDGPASVGFDNRGAMRRLAAHVIACGHRRLAVISAPVEGNDRAGGRVSGVKDAMRQAGLDPDTLPLVETPYGIDTGAEAFAGLMRAPQPPTAVLCGNDVLAVGALRQAREMGLSVPGEVSITGFDDIELAQVAVPALTTVHVPHREMGRRAARMLAGLLRDGEGGGSVELAAELRLRASLSNPPGDWADAGPTVRPAPQG